jgi:hypothetical protein
MQDVYEESQKVAFSTRPAQKVFVSSALLHHTLAATSLRCRNQNVAPDLRPRVAMPLWVKEMQW